MSKILIDEALRLAEAMTFTFPGNKGIDMAAAELRRQALRQVPADAALDKMADNARELGLSYEQPAQQDPVAWMRPDKGHIDHYPHPHYLPLYTAPPKKEWVGLADQEIENLWNQHESREAAVRAERQRIVNLLMVQHEAANGLHNYWHVAANLIKAESGENV